VLSTTASPLGFLLQSCAAGAVPQRDGAADEDEPVREARSAAAAAIVPLHDSSVGETTPDDEHAAGAIGGVASAIPQRDGGSDEEELNSDDDDPDELDEDDEDDDPNTILCQFEKVRHVTSRHFSPPHITHVADVATHTPCTSLSRLINHESPPTRTSPLKQSVSLTRTHVTLCDCQINRVRNRYKAVLRSVIMNVDGIDYMFDKAQGEWEW
jgi:hypothetical protein